MNACPGDILPSVHGDAVIAADAGAAADAAAEADLFEAAGDTEQPIDTNCNVIRIITIFLMRDDHDVIL